MFYLGGAGVNLTAGNYYSVHDRSGSKIMVYDDYGDHCWVDEDFFKD